MASLKIKMIMTMMRMKNYMKRLMQFLQGFQIWVHLIN